MTPQRTSRSILSGWIKRLPRLRTINWALLVGGLPVVGLLRLDLSLERWMQVGLISAPFLALAVFTSSWIRVYRRRWRKTLVVITLVYASILVAAGTLAVHSIRRIRAIDAIVASGGFVNHTAGISIGPWQFSAPKWLRKLGGDACWGDVTHIMLRGPGATDSTIERLHVLSEVHSIMLKNSRVTGASLAELQQFVKLRSLSIESPHFTVDDPAALGRSKNLVELSISSQLLDDEALARLSTLRQLRTLHIGPSDRITDKGLAHLRNLPKIRMLVLVGLHLGDHGLNSLSQIPKLAGLYVMRCRFSDAELVNVQKQMGGQLVFISLDGTNVTQHGVDRLKQALPNAVVNFSPLPPMPGGPELPAERNQGND